MAPPADGAPAPVDGAPAAAGGDALRLPPRLTLPARLMFRLVDPAARGDDAAEANVDQVEPARMVNPVCGFLLPDHIDEALEFFDVAGKPLGQLMHEPIGGGVVWEIAPGRIGPADAGPLFDLAGATTHLGRLAAGTVTADAQFRQGAGVPVDSDAESALSALLRAIDTTMWSVDALSGLGTEHIAGLVGRPIAVVRVRLRLEMESEFGRDAAAAARELADRAFTVRVGEITRADDAVLGYFVDDDYEHVHVVDKVVAQLAVDSGRLRGQLAGIDRAAQVPGTRPIDHPYVIAEDELRLRFGQTVMLTLLMHPAGKANATCGVLPRKAIQLARDWVAPGLAVIAPSARIGPVLIDPAQVRLPKISSFPKEQMFTRRDTPATWKDDPILAATQEALLPDLPHEVQEGYIRIAPDTGTRRRGLTWHAFATAAAPTRTRASAAAPRGRQRFLAEQRGDVDAEQLQEALRVRRRQQAEQVTPSRRGAPPRGRRAARAAPPTPTQPLQVAADRSLGRPHRPGGRPAARRRPRPRPAGLERRPARLRRDRQRRRLVQRRRRRVVAPARRLDDDRRSAADRPAVERSRLRLPARPLRRRRPRPTRSTSVPAS